MTTNTSGGATSTASTPAEAKAHRLDIQGLRAVAVLMVVAFHAGLPIPGGFVGVDVFFVISGFVITAMLMREHERTGGIRLWRFYVRRFKRLTPALAVTVAFVMLASLLLLSPLDGQQAAAKTGLGAMFLAANVMIARTSGGYFDGPAEFNPLLNMWSLSVEEQFYLVFPVLMLAGWLLAKRIGHSRAVLVIFVSLLGVASFILAMAGATSISIPLMPDSLIGFYGPATRAWEFAVGALLALGGTQLTVTKSRTATILAICGSIMVAASMWLIGSSTPFPGPWTLLPVAGTLMLLASGTADSPLRRVLESKAMIAIGDRSYSIYLWHWPFIVFAYLIWSPSPIVLTTAALVSLLPAYASYRWVEQPIRALPSERGWPFLKLVAATMVPPVALGAVLLVVAQNHMWNPKFQDYAAQLTPHHAGMAAGCDLTGWQTPEKCTWNTDATGAPIYLVGDSNADHFSEGLIGAAKALGRPMINLTASGCPYGFPLLSTGSERATQCETFTTGVTEYLHGAHPGTVVLSNASWLYLFGSASVQDTAEGSHDTRIIAFKQSLSSTIQHLQHTGHMVVLVQTLPHWGEKASLEWERCSILRLELGSCARSFTTDNLPQNQRVVADATIKVTHATGVSLLNLAPHVCPKGVCLNTYVNGSLPYRDGTHLTVRMSEQLTSAFEAALSTEGAS